MFCKTHWADIQNIGKGVAEVISTVGGVKGVIDLMDRLKGGRKKKSLKQEINNLESKVVDLENEMKKLKETDKINDNTFEQKDWFVQHAKTGSRGIITNVTYTFISKR